MTAVDLAVALPEIATLRARCQALAMLEAIMSPDWESRYYSFNAAWSDGQQLASMRNGSGDEYSIVFMSAGVFIRGFDHESRMSPAGNDEQLWPGLLDGIPDEFAAQVDEPAFSFNGHLEATFCLWRQTGDDRWHTGRIDFPPLVGHRTDPDGSGMLDILCDTTLQTYLAFAEDYYEIDLPPDATAAAAEVYALRPLSDQIVAALNPDLTVTHVAEDAAEIGYPIR